MERAQGVLPAPRLRIAIEGKGASGDRLQGAIDVANGFGEEGARGAGA
jgi:hypothetical protein